MDRSGSISKAAGKIVHLVLSLETGGLERMVCNLSARVELGDYETVVCCLDEFGALKPELETAGGRAVLVKRKAGVDLMLIFRLARFLRREKATVLHTHSLDPMFFGGVAARLAGVRVLVHTQHDPLPANYGWKDRLKFRTAAKLFDRIVAVSTQTRNALGRYALTEEQCVTVLNGIDEGRFRAPAQSGKSPKVSPDWRIGSVARLSPEKGARVLLQAFDQLNREHPKSLLVLVGDGPERASLELCARDLGIGSAVDFLGTRADVAELLGTFDLFVLPSLSEGIPLALLEAMAAKRPIIASRVGGVPEVIVDGESGVLVTPGDAAGLYQAMSGLLASETRRTALAASAFERVCTRFSEHAMATTYRSLYRVNTAAPLWKKAAKEWMRRLLPRQWLMWSGGPHRPEVAITFDDGPDAVYTPRILDLLERYGAKATFFLIGEKVGRNAALVQRMIDEGHEIANHSFSHPHFERLSWRRAALEVRRAQAIVSSLQDQRCKLFRPPRGKLCWRSLLSAWFEAMTIVMWSVDLKDFSAANAQEIRSAVDARRLAPGDIVLYHGQTPAALEALPYLLEFTMRNGYRAVRVSELLRA